MRSIIAIIIFGIFCFFQKASASVIIEGNIENIPSNKVYLTNRGYGSGASFVLKIFDSCIANEDGHFYFEIKNIDESKYYSIEFSTIKIGWVTLLPRKNEHIQITAAIKDYVKVQYFAGSSENELRKKLDNATRSYINKMNSYADSSSFYYEKNKDSSKYYTKLNKLYYDSLLFTQTKFAASHPKSTLALHILEDNIFDIKKDSVKKILLNADNSVKGLSLYKSLFDFVNTNEVVAAGSYPPQLDIVDSANRPRQLDVSLYHDKIVIVDFWASWCVPCRERIPDLKLMYQSFDLNKYLLISISIDSDKKNWEKALAQENMPWANYIINPDMTSQMFAKYSLESIPKYVVVNSQGKVLLITNDYNTLQEKIQSIIDNEVL